VFADLLDLSAEASTALATMTATALGALVESASDPALRSLDVLSDRDWPPPDLGSNPPQGHRARVFRLRVVPPPVEHPATHPEADCSAKSLSSGANAEMADLSAGMFERGAEAAAALVLNTAAFVLGAIATVTAPAETVAVLMTRLLRPGPNQTHPGPALGRN
jgi:hypothetical protein